MKHAFIDKYAYGDSQIHRLNPVIKVTFALGFILLVLLVSGPGHNSGTLLWFYGGCFFFLFLLVFLSHIPVTAVMKKTAVVFPFIFTVLLLNVLAGNDPVSMGFLLLRSLLSILVLILLVSTTKFHDILHVLATWRVPRVIRLTLSFMYRYFFLLIDEAEKMARAYRVRFQGDGVREKIKIIAVITGMLFIRSYERAERVHYAMVMRGYTGEE